MKKFLLSLSLITLISSLLISCASSTDPAEAYKNESPEQIYQAGVIALRDHNYTEATKRFEALDVQYPYGANTERAQLYLIYAYYQKEEYPLASASADRFIRMHPTNPNVSYAYYMRGVADYNQNLGFIERVFTIDLATRDLTQIQKSYNDFSDVYTRFPNSPYAPSAYQYMVYLRNVLARHELNVANYYYEHRAYVAAANRASGLVAHYQGAPYVLDGLQLMAKSYHELGLTKLEQDTIKVLNYNTPRMNTIFQSSKPLVMG